MDTVNKADWALIVVKRWVVQNQSGGSDAGESTGNKTHASRCGALCMC